MSVSLPVSINDFSLASSWSVTRWYEGGGVYGVIYGTPSNKTKTLTFDFSAVPSGSTVVSAALAYAVSDERGKMDGSTSRSLDVSAKFNAMTGGTFGAVSAVASYQCVRGSQVPSGTGTITYQKDCTFSGVALTLVYALPCSTGALDKTSVDAGGTITLTVTPYTATDYHTARWYIGAHETTDTIAAGATTDAFAVPLAWLAEIPSAVTGTAHVEIVTYQSDGTARGSIVYDFTLTAPASVVPTISAFTATRVDESAEKTLGVYVQGHSKARLTVTAAGAYGSAIDAYAISGDGNSGANATLTTAFLRASGAVKFTATVTDSRGRTATASVTITVSAYTEPAFDALFVGRCTADGTRDPTGTSIQADAMYSCAAIGSNAATLTAEIKASSDTSYGTPVSITSEPDTSSTANAVTLTAEAEVGTSYMVRLTLSDTLSTIVRVVTVPSARFPIHFKNGGRGVGIGCLASEDNVLKIASGWTIKKGSVPMVLDATITTGTTWTGSAAPYTQEISVTGLLASDTPFADIVLDDVEYDDISAALIAYSKIYRMTAGAGKLTVYATEAITETLDIRLKVVRA